MQKTQPVCLLSRLVRFGRLHRDEFDLEDEKLIRPDKVAAADFSISKIRGDEDFPTRAHWHHRDRFPEAGDHFIKREKGGFFALGGFKFFSGSKSAEVVDFGLISLGEFPAWFEDLILESTL